MALCYLLSQNHKLLLERRPYLDLGQDQERGHNQGQSLEGGLDLGKGQGQVDDYQDVQDLGEGPRAIPVEVDPSLGGGEVEVQILEMR